LAAAARRHHQTSPCTTASVRHAAAIIDHTTVSHKPKASIRETLTKGVARKAASERRTPLPFPAAGLATTEVICRAYGFKMRLMPSAMACL